MNTVLCFSFALAVAVAHSIFLEGDIKRTEAEQKAWCSALPAATECVESEESSNE